MNHLLHSAYRLAVVLFAVGTASAFAEDPFDRASVAGLMRKANDWQTALSPRKNPSGSSDETNSPFRTGVREQSRQVPELKLDRFRPDATL
jgi:hypothetical protein